MKKEYLKITLKPNTIQVGIIVASSNVQEIKTFAVLVKMTLHHRKRDNKSLVKATKTIIYIDHRKQSTTNVSADS